MSSVEVGLAFFAAGPLFAVDAPLLSAVVAHDFPLLVADLARDLVVDLLRDLVLDLPRDFDSDFLDRDLVEPCLPPRRDLEADLVVRDLEAFGLPQRALDADLPRDFATPACRPLRDLDVDLVADLARPLIGEVERPLVGDVERPLVAEVPRALDCEDERPLAAIGGLTAGGLTAEATVELASGTLERDAEETLAREPDATGSPVADASGWTSSSLFGGGGDSVLDRVRLAMAASIPIVEDCPTAADCEVFAFSMAADPVAASDAFLSRFDAIALDFGVLLGVAVVEFDSILHDFRSSNAF